MPTYRNDTANDVLVYSHNGREVRFLPFQTLETLYIISHASITKTSDLPYFNPLIAATTITVAVGGPVQTYVTSLATSNIQLTPTAGTPRIYINSQSNLPPMVLLDATTLENRGKIQTLYIDNAGSVSCTLDIKELM